MFDCHPMHSPEQFVESLRSFHRADERSRAQLANTMAEAITTKTVDLAQVRQLLLDQGEAELLDVLHRLVDLIEPYIDEGGAEE